MNEKKKMFLEKKKLQNQLDLQNAFKKMMTKKREA